MNDNEFTLPPPLARVFARRLTDLEPWYFLEPNEMPGVGRGLMHQYPNAGQLVAFARRQDNDNFACFHNGVEKVVIVHGWAPGSPGITARFPDFYAWLRQALEEFIAFDDRYGTT